ncbi:hemerythrin domain-containing protein [Ramlibacter sp. G-1-2-2]|uniref:Hemerythrin domain-containing protein n=1 Tax=Ramlibacter agri TaxID=2728837 RepID=A0A848HCD3_9BURK|nr:hemerythrin domain-containing protein [Ramlibacter agri]NML45208.1 hemerythrin domain-containing protein [Ramlibacter agri]
MNRPNLLHAGPAASFDEPFEMLAACHDRLQRMLALLARLREHLPAHGADAQARQAAHDVMRYFDQAAPQHHRDEELHVFPPLLAQGDPATVERVQALQRDHRQMEEAWERARTVLAAIEGGQLQQPDAASRVALETFSSLYGAHLEAEEQLVFPAARQLLDAAAIREMGREMRLRRGAA